MQRYTDGPDLQGEITPRRIQSCALHQGIVSNSLAKRPAQADDVPDRNEQLDFRKRKHSTYYERLQSPRLKPHHAS